LKIPVKGWIIVDGNTSYDEEYGTDREYIIDCVYKDFKNCKMPENIDLEIDREYLKTMSKDDILEE